MPPIDLEPAAASRAPAICGYAAISLHVVRAIEPFELDLFIDSGNGRPLLFRSRRCEFRLDDATAGCHPPSQWLYIRTEDKPACDARLRRSLDHLLQHEGIPPAERFGVLIDAVSLQLQTAFQRLRIDETVTEAARVGRHITRLVTQSQMLPADLLAIALYNADTFAHILNTSAYAVLLAQELGLADPSDLERIAVGALLHDVGKRFLPKHLIGGVAPLTAQERRLLEEHPQRGYEELHRRTDLTFEQLMMVYQHHERVNGKGYPVGVPDAEIHTWAKLCSVVDIFEALTGKRSYRAAVSVDRALAQLDEWAGMRLDREIVRRWRELLTRRSAPALATA